MTERRCQLDDGSIFRLLRDTMRHIDMPERLTPAARKAMALTVALRIAEAESRATMAEVARCAGVAPPADEGVSEAANELVERIYEHVAVGILEDAAELESIGGLENAMAAATLRQQAVLLAARKDKP